MRPHRRRGPEPPWAEDAAANRTPQVCDHQHRHEDNRNRVGRAQLPRRCRYADPGSVVIVENEIDHPHEIKDDYEQPKDRTYPYREKRQDREHTGCQVPVGRECGKARGQIGPDDAWNDKHESEEVEAVQSSDGALRCDPSYPTACGPPKRESLSWSV